MPLWAEKGQFPLDGLGWLPRGLILAALGVLVALGQAPIDLWWTTLLALSLGFALIPCTGSARAFWHGWALGVGYFAVSLRWIVSPFLVHIEKDGWMAPFALILMAGGFALFWGVAAVATQRLTRWHWLGLPLALTLAEALRALILTGFPWALLGHALVPTPYAQLAAYGGPFLLTVLLAGVAAAIATRRLLIAGPAVVVTVAAWPLLMLPAAPDVAEDAPTVRLIQPNAPQEQKWDPVMSQVFFERMLDYTHADAAPDLVVWPESAIAMLLNHADDTLEQMSEAARGSPVIVGVNREENGLYYNSFVHLERGGQIAGFYDKQHLVPFGEYIPGGDLLHQVGIRGFGSSYGGGFTAGSGQRTLNIPGIGAIRPLICYEGIFAEEVGGTDVRPAAMILITNDAWFGKDAGPFQHLAQARLRAIEQGLPMVRVANTGVSAMIDAQGRIRGKIALNTAGYLDVALPPAAPPTVYSRFGDWPLLALLILAMTVLTWRTRQIKVDPVQTGA